MSTPEIERAVEEYGKAHPCINNQCDNAGCLMIVGQNGETEQEQCEYCYRERFTDLDWLRTALTTTRKEAIEDCLAELPEEMQYTPFISNEHPTNEEVDGFNHAVALMRERLLGKIK